MARGGAVAVGEPRVGSEQMKAMLAKIGFQSNIGTPQDLAAFIADEMARWAEVAKIAHVKIE
jgi:tripartite-type tricarboxylate transporter receptor subunit TctC